MEARREPRPTESLRLLLVSRRPAVREFFAGLAELEHLPPEADALSRHPEALERAHVAAIDIAAEAAPAICEALSLERPELPLVAVVCCPPALTPRALRSILVAGVSGIFDLEGSAEETARSLRSVAAGNSVVNLHLRRTQGALLRDALLGGELRNQATLQLLELVARGLTDAELGEELHLSPHTVKHQIERLRSELGLRNRIELAAWAGRQGFYTPARPTPGGRGSGGGATNSGRGRAEVSAPK